MIYHTEVIVQSNDCSSQRIYGMIEAPEGGGVFRLVFDPTGSQESKTVLVLIPQPPLPPEPKIARYCCNCRRKATYVNYEGYSFCSHYCDPNVKEEDEDEDEA